MKLPRCLVLLVLLLAGGTLSVAAAKSKLLIDFLDMPRNSDGTRQRAFEYAFGDWDKPGVVQIPEKGLLIRNVGSKGGVGTNNDPDFRKFTHARFALVVGDGNQAESFLFGLEDSDGTGQSFAVSLKDLPRGKPLSVLVDLAKPTSEDKPGRKPGLNLKKIATWQIKGNYQDLPVEILILNVTAVDE